MACSKQAKNIQYYYQCQYIDMSIIQCADEVLITDAHFIQSNMIEKYNIVKEYTAK